MVKTPFYLFEGPLILTRQFELQRIASNLLNGLRYRYFVEKNLNQQSFEVGLKSVSSPFILVFYTFFIFWLYLFI